MQSIFGLSQSHTSIRESQNKDQQSNGSHVYLAYHNGECMITRKFALNNLILIPCIATEPIYTSSAIVTNH